VVEHLGDGRLLWPAVALGALAILGHQSGRFGFYADEGLNLLKAYLMAGGHGLYSEIYSDQAPFFTWVLALAMGTFGPESAAPGAIALCCGTAALLGASATAAQVAGRGAAVLCAVLLLVTAPFLKFASAVVLTTPALALGTWSLFLGMRSATSGSPRWAAASGCLLGLAVTTKVAYLYLSPITLMAVWLAPAGRPRGARATAAGAWAVGLAVPVGAVMLASPLRSMSSQLFAPHLAALGVFGQQAADARRAMLLAPGMVLTYLAAGMGLWSVHRAGSRHHAAVLAAWLGVVALWMLVHRPLWAHHLPDLLVPVSVVVSAGAMTSWRVRPALPPGRARWLALLPVALWAMATAGHAANHQYWRRWYDSPSERSLRAVAQAIETASVSTDRVVVDRPILAFWAQRRTPPELAVISNKRLQTGGITDGLLTAALERFSPRVVCLCTQRLSRFRDFLRTVRRDYHVLTRLDLDLHTSGRRTEVCHLFVRRPARAVGRPTPPH
jgi:4-amino-4-deoxy-L-arabinose transferase-like glycosyltransferase